MVEAYEECRSANTFTSSGLHGPLAAKTADPKR
jgi:hypothetical protein